jgi:hypothetical protein
MRIKRLTRAMAMLLSAALILEVPIWSTISKAPRPMWVDGIMAVGTLLGVVVMIVLAYRFWGE